MAHPLYTAADLIKELSQYPRETAIIVQTCCHDDDASCGGVQVCTVKIDEDGRILPMPDDESNALALEIINVNA